MRQDRSTGRRDALLLLVVQHDTAAMARDDGWVTPCLHCRSTLAVTATGAPLGATTLEHILPRSWFRQRSARVLVERVGAPDDVRNLALACARCNQQKGKSHDADGPSSERAREVITALLDARAARLPTGGVTLPPPQPPGPRRPVPPER
jgi:5-methylcytosine-specific restriction endonuclease McrA